MNLLLLTRYGRLGASSRLRAYQYVPYLESQGLHVTSFPFFSASHQSDLYEGRSPRLAQVASAYASRLWHLLRARTFDLLWVEYELFPWLPALAERMLRRVGIPFVVDYDDAIFSRYELHRNPLVRLLLGKKIDEVMRCANAVIAGNEYLVQRAKAVGACQVFIIPTVVDLTRYPPRPRQPDGPFTIGWIGSPSTVKYLSLIAPVLARMCERGQARLVVIGVRDANLNGIPVEVRPWSEDTEAAAIGEFDVGIMPLPDEPWERGKCGYKLVQYMASMRPVIASPVGANKQIVEDGINGFLATTHQEWLRALNALRSSPETGERLGQAGRERVEREFSLQVSAPRLEQVLRSIAVRSGVAP